MHRIHVPNSAYFCAILLACDSCSCCLMQALERVRHDVTTCLPGQNDEQKAEVQEQITLLAQIAQGCMSGV